MAEKKVRTFHFETLSLAPLKMVLTNAGKETPPRASKQQKDVNEELALKLISRMKKGYKKFRLFADRL